MSVWLYLRRRMGEMLDVCTAVFNVCFDKNDRPQLNNPGAASVGETESTTVAAVGFLSIAKTTGRSTVTR